ncbi:alpha/beta hydrolase [Picosynechococcus sp. PCC 11901]|uniref:alpha/beta fold hydrolase n=1 Tax=Picosynechococcus sp. PCC 11901 TaxID=2579791 RepID=UPI0010FBEDD1|nr:alpha/beta hydrolase [Picosynechococcus sp. PCC 11901]QCS50087.1 alpha/beta hydrolase [Picosynechococcus sp. PCC 11901]
MAIAQVRGVPHYYEWICCGGCDLPKPVMLFVHGWGGSSHYWRNTATAFSEFFHCLIYDLRGFGRSELPVDYSGDYALDDYALDLEVLLRQLDINSPIILNAHSMGASIGAIFAAQFPQRLDRAILNCNGIFEYDARAFGTFQKIAGTIVRLRFPWLRQVPGLDRLAIARFLQQPIAPTERRQFLEDFLSADNRAAAGTLLASVNEMMVTRLPQAFRNIQCPTLFLAGEKDQIIPAAMAKKAIALNPNFRYIEIPQVGHFPMLENPHLYQAEIQQFLRDKFPG